ncbi:MAG: acyltransferase family protein [Lactobacillus sp.]|jgi:fucose 4-O-acetylase-like acetyltransferase|nr:acyltransferase family protein [Lactobacillus sp.]
MMHSNQKTTQTTQRIQWIDIAKALGIMAVVIGHSYPVKDTFYQTIYWWHMPLFFIVGGFFVKPLGHDWPDLKQFGKHRIWPLLKIYFGSGLLIIGLNFLIEKPNVVYTLDYFGRLLYGGTELNGYTSVFWFLTVYLIALLLLQLILYLPSRLGQFSLVFSLFLLGTSYSNAEATLGFPMPWNADVALMACFYMWMGQFGFQFIKRWVASKGLLVGALIGASTLVLLQKYNIINQLLYMKSHHITNSWFAMIVPFIFATAILGLAYWLQFTPLRGVLTTIGQHTLPIMLGHKALFSILDKSDDPTWLVLSVGGIIVPLMAMQVAHLVKSYYQGVAQRLYW